MGRVQTYAALNCAVNPQTCRERIAAYQPILKKKRVLIVGGGVAGCEAARVLATRGHEPVLYEKSETLGGHLIPGGAPDFKHDDIALMNWYTHQLETLGVAVHLNTPVDEPFVLSTPFDAVIMATGSKPNTISLGDDTRVFTAEQVLLKQKEPGPCTVVMGGGLIGCETALWMARQGKTVTIVEQMDAILSVNGPLCHANSDMLEALIPYNGIDIKTNACVTSFENGMLTLATNGEESRMPCDSVILAVGYHSDKTLYEKIRFKVPNTWVLGDARRVSNIMYAIWDAFEVANGI